MPSTILFARIGAKTLTAFAGIALAATLCACSAPSVSKENAPQAIAASLAHFDEGLSFATDDADETIKAALESDPRLFYFYNGYNGTLSQDGTAQVKWEYKNKGAAIGDVALMSAAEDLDPIIAEAVAARKTSIEIVSTTPELNRESIDAAFGKIKESGAWEAAGGKSYAISRGTSDYNAFYEVTISVEYAGDASSTAGSAQPSTQPAEK